MNDMKNRIKYIDISKCIAMLLVIHNHWMLDYDNNGLKIIIASFHMPLFFVLSGMTLKIPESVNEVKRHVLNRIKTILLPFYLWSFLYIGFKIKKIIFILWGSNLSIGAAGGIGGSWFLPCFFIADILTYLALYFCRKKIKFIFIFIFVYFFSSWLLNNINISVGFPFNFDVAFSGAGFICLGIVAKNYKIFDKMLMSSLISKLLFLLISLLAVGFFALLNTSAYNNLFNRLVMARGYYGNFFMFILGGISGTFFIIIFSMIIEKTKISGYIQKIGMNTFTILMLQQLCIDCIEKIIVKVEVSLNFVIPVVLSVVCIILCHYTGLIITGVFPNLKGKNIIPEYEKVIEKKFIKE